MRCWAIFMKWDISQSSSQTTRGARIKWYKNHVPQCEMCTSKYTSSQVIFQGQTLINSFPKQSCTSNRLLYLILSQIYPIYPINHVIKYTQYFPDLSLTKTLTRLRDTFSTNQTVSCSDPLKFCPNWYISLIWTPKATLQNILVISCAVWILWPNKFLKILSKI